MMSESSKSPFCYCMNDRMVVPKEKGAISTLVKHEAIVMTQANPLVNSVWLFSSRVVVKYYWQGCCKVFGSFFIIIYVCEG